MTYTILVVVRTEELGETIRDDNDKNKSRGEATIGSVSYSELRHAVEVACSRLIARFRFGYHDIEDMRQEAYVLAIEVLQSGKYDESRPLTTFLYVHIHNRLYNFKRRHYARLSPPCSRCPLASYIADPIFISISGFAPVYNGCCSSFQEPEECSLYAGWQSRNRAKQSLAHTAADSGEFSREEAAPRLDTIQYLDWVEKALPPEQRKVWDAARSGRRVNPVALNLLLDWIGDNILLC